MSMSDRSVTLGSEIRADAERIAAYAERFPGAIILPYGDAWPEIADSAFIAPGAVVIGDARIGEYVSIWFHAVVRGDIAPIQIGDGSNVQDGSVVHVNGDAPVVIGQNVTIGHSGLVHGTTIGDGCLVGMGAIIMSYSEVGRQVTVAAGAVVTERTVVPDGAVMVGMPAKQRGELSQEKREDLAKIGPRYVGVSQAYAARLRHIRHRAHAVEEE